MFSTLFTLGLLGAVPAPLPILDTNSVRVLYREGDFDKVLESLCQTLKSRPALDRDDSAFIFKHLGVIYAAEITTREKGKYYLYQMLRAEPDADIVDMYASDAIYEVFRNVRREFETREHKSTKTSVLKPKKSGGKGLFWAGGAVLAVGAGVAAYFLLNEPETTVHNNLIQ